MERGDAIDRVTSDNRQVGHADVFMIAFFDNRHTLHTVEIPRPHRLYLAQKAVIDFIDQLQMPRQDVFKQRQGPLFERLWEEGMIGVGQGRLRNSPGFVPGHVVDINQQPHQFRHGQRRVRIV